MERPRILVIDDEEIIRQLLSQTLARRGYHVEPAEDGPAALKKVSEGFFNLLITDLKMPGMNVIEVLKEIKKINPYIEVIIITGYPTIETAVEAIKIGAFDFLCKPFDVPEIISVIQRCLEKQQGALDHVELGELEALFEISKTMPAYSDLDALLRQILDSTLRLVKAKSGSLVLFDEKDKELHREWTAGDNGKGARQDTGHPDDKKADTRPFLSIPLMSRYSFSRRDILGVINVSEKISGEGFTLREQTLFSVLSGQAVAAIENYRLYAQLQEKIGALERTIKELEETKNQLIQSEKLAAVGQLAFGIAHEIRNPLAIILEGVEFLRADRDAAGIEADEALVLIKRAIDRTNNIIVDLLKFSRASKIQTQEVDIGRILDEVTVLIRNPSCLHHVRVRKECGSADLILRGDPNMLQQVFFNLCMNAIDAMPQGGDLVLGACRRRHADEKEEAIVVTVSDTGSGIPEDALLKIFNPFFTTKEPGKGTGLGLSIVHLILERHGAAIDVKSAGGRGTAFTITFPSHGLEAKKDRAAVAPGTAGKMP